MIGSISKVRPAGHHHWYKYGHANGKSDLSAVSNDYKNDLREDGETWEFSLDNITDFGRNAFQNTNIHRFKAFTPNCVSMNSMFNTDSYATYMELKEFDVTYDKVTNVNSLFHSVGIKEIPANFNPKTRSFWLLLRGSGTSKMMEFNKGKFPYNEVLNEATDLHWAFGMGAPSYKHSYWQFDDRFEWKDVTNITGCFGWSNYPYYTHYGLISFPKNLSFKNLITANSSFIGHYDVRMFETKDNMSELTESQNMFTRCYNLRHFYPNTETISWPKLNNASGMFSGCRLDKKSVLKICNALPTYTNGSHPITIGCHIDLKNDPEVNLALKKVDVNFIPEVELSENITEGKGWTLTVNWNGTSNDEYYNPSDLDFSIQLPDGYTRCLYLEGWGWQWLDTGIIPNKDTGIEVVSNPIRNVTYTYPMGCNNFYPALVNKKTSNDCYGDYYGSGFQFGNVTNGEYNKSSINFLNNKKAELTLSGETYYSKDISTSYNGTLKNPIYIFALNRAIDNLYGSEQWKWLGRIYRARISQGEEIIRDFIPCLDETGKPCMWERIEGKAYHNVNSEELDFMYDCWEIKE